MGLQYPRTKFPAGEMERNLHRAARDFTGKSFLWSYSTATKEIGLALNYLVILIIESMYA